MRRKEHRGTLSSTPACSTVLSCVSTPGGTRVLPCAEHSGGPRGTPSTDDGAQRRQRTLTRRRRWTDEASNFFALASASNAAPAALRSIVASCTRRCFGHSAEVCFHTGNALQSHSATKRPKKPRRAVRGDAPPTSPP
jgi:hypothetical protein